MLQSVRVSPATSHHLRVPPPPHIPIYLYTCFLLFYCAAVIYTGEASFPLPSSIVFTAEYPLNLLPPHPFPVLSIFLALCVLLRSSNFPFDFGGNAFFTNQRGSQPAPPPTPSQVLFLQPSFPPSLPPPRALPSLSPILAPLGPPGQRGDKGAPSFPC